MKLFRYATIPLIIASTMGTARADDDRFYVAPMFSYAIGDDDDRHADDGLGGTLAIGVPLTTNFALELRGTYLDYDTSHVPAQGLGNPAYTHGNKVKLGGAGFNWYLASENAGPYLHADVMGGSDTAYNVGLGFDVPLGSYFAIRAEALYHWQDYSNDGINDHFNEPLFNLGVKIPLGAKKAPPPPPPPAPAMVVPAPPPPPPPPQCSDGIDNDGDGAIDFPADKGCTDANDNDEYNPICKTPAPGEKVNLEGCGVGDTIVLQGVTFEFDKARLTPNAKVILDGVAEALIARPDIKVELGGHTDAKGSDSYNLNLSDRRAKSVKDYLVTKGIESSRMTSKGYGESVPVADNATDEGRELNRRVELKVTESTGAVTVAPTQRTAENAAPLEASSVGVMAAPAPAAGGNTVSIANFAFAPASLTVAVGTTVTWTNADGSNHFVAFSDQKSDRLKKGGTYTRTFSAPGTYDYSCTLHPEMKGTVVVQ